MFKKTIRVLFASAAAAAVFAFSACTLPSAAEIRVKPEISLPVSGENGDFSDIFFKAIRDNLVGEDEKIKVIQWHGKPEQTFLIQHRILDKFELGFLDEINDALDFTLDFDFGEENSPIDLGALHTLGAAESYEVDIDVSATLNAIMKTFNDSIADYKNREPDKLAIVSGYGEEPPEGTSLEIDPFDFEFSGFTDVTFGSGSFHVILTIYPGDASHPLVATMPIVATDLDGAHITYNRIELKNAAGETIATGKTTGGSEEVTLTGEEPSQKVIFEFGDTPISSDFGVFFIDDITDASADLKALYLSVVPDGLSDDACIRGVSGFTVENDTPIRDTTVFDLDFSNLTFYHAEIAEGSIDFDVSASSVQGAGSTWMSGLNFEPHLVLHQALAPIDPALINKGDFPTEWPGLSKKVGNAGDAGLPWAVTPDDKSLAGRHINANGITIDENDSRTFLRMTSGDGGASFLLSDSDMANKSMTVYFSPTLDITKFAEIHVNASDFADLPEPQTIDLGAAGEYITSIDFTKIGVEILFGEVDVPGLEMMVKVPGLLNDSATPVYKPVLAHQTIDFIENDTTLYFEGAQQTSELVVELDIRVNNVRMGENAVMTIEDLDATKSELLFQIMDVKFVYEWEDAVVSLSEPIEGKYPEDDGSPPMEFSSLRDIIDGFTFNDIKAYLYMNGSHRFFSLNTGLTMKAIYTKNGETIELDLLPDDFAIEQSAVLNLDPDGDGVCTLSSLPPKRIELMHFNTILNDLPDDLRFEYKVANEFVVDQEILNKELDATDTPGEYINYVNADILLVFPMRLDAGPGAKIKITDTALLDRDDILDRGGSDGSSLLDNIKINKLVLKAELASRIFDGGTLYIKRAGEADGQENLQFPLSEAANGPAILSIPVTDAMLNGVNGINTHNPYKVEEIGIRFNEGESIIIPNAMGVVRIELVADMQYTYEF